jgi:hypothetical protein
MKFRKNKLYLGHLVQYAMMAGHGVLQTSDGTKFYFTDPDFPHDGHNCHLTFVTFQWDQYLQPAGSNGYTHRAKNVRIIKWLGKT